MHTTVQILTAGGGKGHHTPILLAVKRDTPCITIIHTAGSGKGYTLHSTAHVLTAGGGKGYILHIHTAGGGQGYTIHVHTAGGQ